MGWGWAEWGWDGAALPCTSDRLRLQTEAALGPASQGQPACTPNEQTRFNAMLNYGGLVDTYRARNPEQPNDYDGPVLTWRGAPSYTESVASYSGKGVSPPQPSLPLAYLCSTAPLPARPASRVPRPTPRPSPIAGEGTSNLLSRPLLAHTRCCDPRSPVLRCCGAADSDADRLLAGLGGLVRPGRDGGDLRQG